jgi:hypothetical protein
MTVEFGALRDGSSVTLVGEYRVSVPEELAAELAPIFRRIEAASGQELNPYGSAIFVGQALEQFINEVEAALRWSNASDSQLEEFLSELLRIASFARQSGKALAYFGE